MADKLLVKRTVKAVKNNANGRAVAMYGRNLDIQKALENEGIKIDAVFTGNRDLLADKSLNCSDSKDMDGKADKYYIVIPFILPDGGKSQQDFLQKCGYHELLDYFFCQPIKQGVILTDSTIYDDNDGNVVKCQSDNVTIQLNGKNNQIEILDANISGKLLIKINGNNNKIHIEKNTFYSSNNTISVTDSVNIYIDEYNYFSSTSILCYNSSKLLIGSNGRFDGGFKFLIHPYSDVQIGKEALFSFDVVLQTGDGHSIFDLDTGENLNSNLNKVNDDNNLSELILEEHVWVGRDVMIMAGLGRTKIGEGSIVGAKSFVKGIFPNNCIIAGIPAKVIKKNIAWSHKNRSDNKADCGKYIRHTEEQYD